MKIINNDENDEKKILKNLKKIKTLDLDMTKLIQLLRQYFKWILLLNITHDVITLIVDFYWIYGGLIFGNNPNFPRELKIP